MESTGYSRKLDTMGRIMLPKPLREQLRLVIGEEYEFFRYEDKDGHTFLCIKCPEIDEATLEEARRIVQKYGMKRE